EGRRARDGHLKPELPGTFPGLSQDLHSASREICGTWRASPQSTRAFIRERRMKRTSIATAVAMTAAVTALDLAFIPSAPPAMGQALAPALGQDETDQRFGTVHFATSCNETA